jgi:hypothetical protein
LCHFALIVDWLTVNISFSSLISLPSALFTSSKLQLSLCLLNFGVKLLQILFRLALSSKIPKQQSAVSGIFADYFPNFTAEALVYL